MKSPTLTGVLFMAATFAGGCVDREAEVKRAQEEAAAKARAEAAQKEMEALPKAFKSRDIFKKNEPADATSSPVPTTDKSN